MVDDMYTRILEDNPKWNSHQAMDEAIVMTKKELPRLCRKNPKLFGNIKFYPNENKLPQIIFQCNCCKV